MKVLDLQCGLGHIFEGWFVSEADFVSQSERSLVECPVCGDPSVVKKLSAPRLNLSGSRTVEPVSNDHSSFQGSASGKLNSTDTWVALARQLVAETTDVGDQFAEEARRVHYGERKARGLRGTTTREEAQALVDEGIEVFPFALPLSLKGRLQ